MTAEAQWFVCHTRPRREKKFAALMEAERFEHYLPLIESVRRYARQTRRFSKPLFPGYVFALIPAELKTRIYQQELLARAIPVADAASLLRQLADVRALIASGEPLHIMPLLTHGRRARILSGPLRGIEGVIDDPASPKGVVISVDVLRQGVLVCVPPDELQALP